MSEESGKPPIVLIHGLWMTPRSWEKWKAHYEAKGHEVIAPAWPGMEAEVEALNEDPTPIAELDVPKVVDYYEELINGMDEEPIIMGHSFGGTFVQLLLDRGCGKAGVGVAPGTVKGIPDLPLSTLRATSPVLGNPFNKGKATALDEKQFHYAFCNTLTQEESDEIYKCYHVPAANTVLFQGAFATFHRHPPTEVDFENDDRAPMLFLAFENDHIIPPSVAKHNCEKYKSDTINAFIQFDGRPHFPAVEGWEEVADFALNWALNPTEDI